MGRDYEPVPRDGQYDAYFAGDLKQRYVRKATILKRLWSLISWWGRPRIVIGRLPMEKRCNDRENMDSCP